MARFFFVIFSAFLLVCFVMNKSISRYLEQRYHIYFFPQSEILDEANAFFVKLEKIKNVLFEEDLPNLDGNFSLNLSTQSSNPQNLTPNLNPKNASLGEISRDEISWQDLNANLKPQSQNLALNLNSQSPNPSLNLNANSSENPQNFQSLNAQEIIKKLDIKEGEEFLLMGDSMMQGVATALVKDLKNLGIKSTNLSKQNTGLSYKNYFNWAEAIQFSLENNANIKYLAVLLGANDPWDLKEKGKFYSFKSEEWREIYAKRVDEIMQIAKNFGVRVLWYEIPPVRREILNEKIQILNEIYKNEIAANGEIFIFTSGAMGGVAYSSYIKDENNRSLKVRADDGVHFNPRGAKIMSNLLLKHIEKKAENEF